VLDTNVCLSYSLSFTIRFSTGNFPLKAKYSDSIKRYLQSLPARNVETVIPDVVENEFNRKVWDVLCELVKRANLNVKLVPPLLIQARGNFNRLKKKSRVVVASNGSIIKVKDFYSDLWTRSGLQHKREAWARLKRKNVSDGPPKGADISILAVGVDMLSNNPELLTLDNDFLVFSNEILSDLGVIIRDAATV